MALGSGDPKYNPLVYTDPSGEFWHLVIGAAIGGTINWLTHGAEFTWKGLGYFGVGIFSADRDYAKLSILGQGPHGIMSYLAFGGFTFGAFFMGWLIVLYDTKIPKPLGVYGILGPLTVAIINLIESTPFIEWLLLFSILAWVIPLSLILFMKEEFHPND